MRVPPPFRQFSSTWIFAVALLTLTPAGLETAASFSFTSLGDPIQPLGPVSVNEEDTQALLNLREWAQQEWRKVCPRSVLPDDALATQAVKSEEADLLLAFTTNYPASFWTLPIQARLGQYYRQAGRSSTALERWEKAWEQTRSFRGGRVKEVADYTLGNYVSLLSRLGRTDSMAAIFAETEGRILPFGMDAQLYSRALQALGTMRADPV